MKLVETIKTPYDIKTLAAALKVALDDLYPDYENINTVRILYAHSNLEMGANAYSSKNWQVGNVMSSTTVDGLYHNSYFNMDATEYENGTLVMHHSHWRAYDNLMDACKDWITLLNDKFRALPIAAKGTPGQYVYQLSEAHYMTCPQYKYLSAFMTVWNNICKVLSQEIYDNIDFVFNGETGIFELRDPT